MFDFCLVVVVDWFAVHNYFLEFVIWVLSVAGVVFCFVYWLYRLCQAACALFVQGVLRVFRFALCCSL